MRSARSEIAKQLFAFYPRELLDLYARGRRNFDAVNLLRRELESNYSSEQHFLCAEHPQARDISPLWLDFLLGAGETDFEWDRSGRCLSVQGDDLPDDRDLRSADLSDISLEGAYLYPVNFSRATLARAKLKHAVFLDCNMQNADLSRSDLRDARFDRCDLTGANLYMARMDRCRIVDSRARGANFDRAKLKKTMLVRVDLRRATLGAHFDQTVLSGSDLRDVDLEGLGMPDVVVNGVRISSSQEKLLLDALNVKVDEEP